MKRTLLSILGLIWLVGIFTETLRVCAADAAGPLSPAEEMATFQLADKQLIVELAAAEPNVLSPVAITWDTEGRMFVAEMTDYPSAPGGGQIRMLEDLDGDGQYEKATVFATDLPFPNGVLPWNGGLLVTAAPNIWFLKDTDGDGRANERRVLFTGFGEGNQQLRVNGLFWGLDNWVYGANGRSDGDVRRPNDPASQPISIRRHDFRFRPDTALFETITGYSQFGLARDDWGNRFISWNTIPLRHAVLDEQHLNQNLALSGLDLVSEVLPKDESNRVFPLTPPPLVFNNEPFGYFNALAGLTIFRGDALGESYLGNAFVGESLRNLAHRRVLEPNGVTFTARRGDEGKEFLASSDGWFHPVNFATGPDGALYIVDFYRKFVEHPQWVPEGLRESVSWRRGAEHGRIWRIRNPSLVSKTRKPALSLASNAELVRHLGDATGWWRDTAQRVLRERQDRRAIPFLKAEVRKTRSDRAIARVHALWTLEALDALDAETVRRALRDSNPRVREHAVRLSKAILAKPNTRTTQSATPSHDNRALQALTRLVNDRDPRVRHQLALSLGAINSPATLQSLVALAHHDVTNRWQAIAIVSSVSQMPGEFVSRLKRQNQNWWTAPATDQAWFLQKLGESAALAEDKSQLPTLLRSIGESDQTPGNVLLLAGVADRSPRKNAANPEGNDSIANEFENLVSRYSEPARIASLATNEPIHTRMAAVRLLERASGAPAGTLLKLLNSRHPPELQAAAARALVQRSDADSFRAALANWRDYSNATRRQLIASSANSDALLPALLELLEQGTVPITDLDAVTRQKLKQTSNADFQRRIAALLPDTKPLDQKTAPQLQPPILALEGNRARGADWFAKRCMNCHAVQGAGGRVGPDLSGAGARPKPALLVDILDPSRQITPDFVSFTVGRRDGQTLTGVLSAETTTSITLRRVGEPDLTIPRSDVVHLQADKKSVMPDGLAEGMSAQDLADLLAFLQQPDRTLLPKSD